MPISFQPKRCTNPDSFVEESFKFGQLEETDMYQDWLDGRLTDPILIQKLALLMQVNLKGSALIPQKDGSNTIKQYIRITSDKVYAQGVVSNWQSGATGHAFGYVVTGALLPSFELLLISGKKEFVCHPAHAESTYSEKKFSFKRLGEDFYRDILQTMGNWHHDKNNYFTVVDRLASSYMYVTRYYPKYFEFFSLLAAYCESEAVALSSDQQNIYKKFEWYLKAIDSRVDSKNENKKKHIDRIMAKLKRTIDALLDNNASEHSDRHSETLLKLKTIAEAYPSCQSVVAYLQGLIGLHQSEGSSNKIKNVIACYEQAAVDMPQLRPWLYQQYRQRNDVDNAVRQIQLAIESRLTALDDGEKLESFINDFLNDIEVNTHGASESVIIEFAKVLFSHGEVSAIRTILKDRTDDTKVTVANYAIRSGQASLAQQLAEDASVHAKITIACRILEANEVSVALTLHEEILAKLTLENISDYRELIYQIYEKTKGSKNKSINQESICAHAAECGYLPAIMENIDLLLKSSEEYNVILAITLLLRPGVDAELTKSLTENSAFYSIIENLVRTECLIDNYKKYQNNPKPILSFLEKSSKVDELLFHIVLSNQSDSSNFISKHIKQQKLTRSLQYLACTKASSQFLGLYLNLLAFMKIGGLENNDLINAFDMVQNYMLSKNGVPSTEKAELIVTYDIMKMLCGGEPILSSMLGDELSTVYEGTFSNFSEVINDYCGFMSHVLDYSENEHVEKMLQRAGIDLQDRLQQFKNTSRTPFLLQSVKEKKMQTSVVEQATESTPGDAACASTSDTSSPNINNTKVLDSSHALRSSVVASGSTASTSSTSTLDATIVGVAEVSSRASASSSSDVTNEEGEVVKPSKLPAKISSNASPLQMSDVHTAPVGCLFPGYHGHARQAAMTAGIIFGMEAYRFMSNGNLITGFNQASSQAALVGLVALFSQNAPMAIGVINGGSNCLYVTAGGMLSLPWKLISTPLQYLASAPVGLVSLVANASITNLAMIPLHAVSSLFNITLDLLSFSLTLPIATIGSGLMAAGIAHTLQLNKDASSDEHSSLTVKIDITPAYCVGMFMAYLLLESYRNISDGALVSGLFYAVMNATVLAAATHITANQEPGPRALAIGSVGAVGSLLFNSWSPTTAVTRGIATAMVPEITQQLKSKRG